MPPWRMRFILPPPPALGHKLASLSVPMAVLLPGGERLGPLRAPVTVRLNERSPLMHIAAGQVGRVARDWVEGRVELQGTMRDLMAIARQLVEHDPRQLGAQAGPAAALLRWWLARVHALRSIVQHERDADARQVQFHYDVSDDFFALWLDPLRIYSCAYFREPDMALAEAQQAKLEHICRKLMLRKGERFLDVGAGWGALLLWAAEHHGVQAHGITLSRNQHAHVNRLIDERGLRGQVTMSLLDYRDLPEQQPFDKIASVGMFEHVGRARLPGYFGKLYRLLKPGGLLLNHGITAGGTHNHELGAGIGDFIERYIFPGGSLQHVSHMLRVMSEAQLEPLDAENLRPHYARTLWAWSDALESQLAQAARVTPEPVVRAYRMYLAGSAMSFEQGWISLFQTLAARPSGQVSGGTLRGAQSDFPFNRGYMYP